MMGHIQGLYVVIGPDEYGRDSSGDCVEQYGRTIGAK